MKWVLVWIAVALTCGYGWVMNAIALAGMNSCMDQFGLCAVRILGIFVAPLGVILGWFL